MQVERPSATSSVSDISDTELPDAPATTAESEDGGSKAVTTASAGGAGEGLSDLSDLEAERAKLRAQLAKAKISDPEFTTSEGEIHSSDDQTGKAESAEQAGQESKDKLEALEPISSSEGPSPVPPKVCYTSDFL